GLKESRALANLSAQRDSGMDLWNRAQDVSSRLNQDVLEVLGAVRALREGGSRMSPQATLRLVESMGERVRATGETLNEAVGFIQAMRQLGVDDPDWVSRFVVARGVTLGEATQYAQQFRGTNLSDRQLAQALVGVELSGGQDFTLSRNLTIRQQQL